MHICYNKFSTLFCILDSGFRFQYTFPMYNENGVYEKLGKLIFNSIYIMTHIWATNIGWSMCKVGHPLEHSRGSGAQHECYEIDIHKIVWLILDSLTTIINPNAIGWLFHQQEAEFGVSSLRLQVSHKYGSSLCKLSRLGWLLDWIGGDEISK